MMHNPHGVFLADLFPPFCLRQSGFRGNMALPLEGAEKAESNLVKCQEENKKDFLEEG